MAVKVSEIFHSIQGESSWAGTAMRFYTAYGVQFKVRLL